MKHRNRRDDSIYDVCINFGFSSAWPNGMSHRKWRETKQQLMWWPDLALLGWCLVYLHFLCDIPFGHTVHSTIKRGQRPVSHWPLRKWGVRAHLSRTTDVTDDTVCFFGGLATGQNISESCHYLESAISVMCFVNFVFIKWFRPTYTSQKKTQFVPQIHPTCHRRPGA